VSDLVALLFESEVQKSDVASGCNIGRLVVATARRSRPAFWWATAFLAAGWLIVIVETAFSVPVPLPLWLMLIAGALGLASTVVRPTRPKLSEYLVIAMGLISVAAIIVIAILIVSGHS
jgi:hypothetical protein